MQNFQIYAVCICIAAIAYFYGRSRIISYVNAAQKRANSLPVYYGVFPALIALIMPALIIASWLITESIIMDMMLLNSLPASITQAEEFSDRSHWHKFIIWPPAFRLGMSRNG